MLQGWAQLSFSSLVAPNLRPLVFYASTYRVQSGLEDRNGRGVRKREPGRGHVTGTQCHSSSSLCGDKNSLPRSLTPGWVSPTQRDSLVHLPTSSRKINTSNYLQRGIAIMREMDILYRPISLPGIYRYCWSKKGVIKKVKILVEYTYRSKLIGH